jgi:DNA-binding SARP family transcriptional activator
MQGRLGDVRFAGVTRVQVLGPVEVTVGERRLELGAAKRRALLAMLALQANRAVPADRLVEGLWGGQPPASAAKMVQHHVSRLRKTLAAGDGAAVEIVTRGRGFELRITADDVDALRFERLVVEGSSQEALALWRGPALADVAHEPFAAGRSGGWRSCG